MISVAFFLQITLREKHMVIIIALDCNYSANTHFYRNCCYNVRVIIILYVSYTANRIARIPIKMFGAKKTL